MHLVYCDHIDPLFDFKFDKSHLTDCRPISVNKIHGLFLILVNLVSTAEAQMTQPHSHRGPKLGSISRVAAAKI